MDHPDIAATNGERPLQSFINPFTEVYNTRKYIESHYNEVNKHFLADGSGDILHRQLHIKSLIWYPFSFYEDGFYVFTLNQILVQRQWTQEETGFLESVAKQVSLALIKIKLLDEQKNAQKELAKSEMRFRQVVEQSQEVVWEVDANGLYTYVSPISLAIYGYLPEQMIGKMYFFDLHPEAGRKKFKEAAFDIFHRKEGFYKLVNQIVKPDGRLAVLTTNGIPMMDENGNLTGYRGSDADITQTKLAEQEILNLNKNLEKKIAERTEQLDLVIKGSNDAPWDWNLVTDHLFYSLKWWQQLGYSPEEIPADSSLWRKLTHADDVEHTNKIFEEAINSENDSYEAEFRLLHKNGHYVPVLSRGYITRDETGKPIRVSGTNMDLTERKRTEAEIIRSRDEANKANLAKSEFLSRMSHELRTPMNSILGFAQLLNMGELNPKQKKGIGHILTSGKHLLDLIDEVLDISRIESGKLSLMPEPVQLSSLIAEVMDTVLPMADSQHLKLELENSPSNQLFVMSDRKRLTQLLLNLLNNAVKYNKEGGAISVKTELLQRDVQGTALVRISVTDTGQGIAPDDIPKLFIPFERIGAEKTQTEGAGLGLAIVKKIVAAMEGSVGVESVVGEGSTFWIDLPVTGNQKSWQDQKEDNSKLTSRLIEANHEIAFQIEEKSKRAAELVIIKKEHSDEMKEILKTGSTGTAKTGTILYIEDNIQNAELVEEILEIHHPEIRLIIAMFGNQGIKLAINNLPDLILLDLGLPDLTGSDVLASLQANDQTKSIPVVVVTADATLQQIEKLMTAGAKDYLTKPLDIPMFLQVVDEWIGVKDLTTQPVYNT
jgi:PAS domain S-box-containing protein